MSRRFNSKPSSDFVQFDQQNPLMFPCPDLPVMLFSCMHTGPCALLLTFTHRYWLSAMITRSLNGFSELYLDPLFWPVPFSLIALIERQFEFKMLRESWPPDWIMITDQKKLFLCLTNAEIERQIHFSFGVNHPDLSYEGISSYNVIKRFLRNIPIDMRNHDDFRF